MRHLKFLFALTVAALSTGLCAAVIPDGLYAVGGFQGWNINAPVAFDLEDGIFTKTIDFSTSREFKISTVNTTDISDNAWAVFDSGVYGIGSQATLNTPCPLAAGNDANITVPEGKVLTVIVDFADMTITFSDGGEPDKPYSGTLPVMFINTEDNAPIVSKDTYLKATWWLDPMGVEGTEAFGSEAEPKTMQIRGRGNYTWTGFDKKPYRLKLDSKEPLLGMDKSKHFALLAHADDNRGFLRNPVGFRLSELIGMEWTPAHRPVEVVLNGDYIGLYFLTETIRVDKNRVNIVEQPDLATAPDEITGGWLVEIDNYDTDPHVTVTEHGSDYPIWFTYKTPEELSAEQESYLTSQMSTLNDLIFGDKDDMQLWQHLDLDQAARFYIIQEIIDNTEAYHGSCYLHKQQGDDTRWTYGPVWDFGSTMWSDKSDYVTTKRPHYQVWIGEICKHPAFMERVTEIWREFSGSPLHSIYSYIDTFADEIATACVYDARRWPQYGNPDEAEKAQSVKSFIEGSVKWLSDRWGYTGIENVDTSNIGVDIEISVNGNIVTVTTATPSTITVAGIDGRHYTVTLAPGDNAITLAPGFYIIAGQKIVIR